MQELLYYGSEKLRLAIGGIFIVFGIFALIFMLSVFQAEQSRPTKSQSSSATSSSTSSLSYDSPNIVALGLADMANSAGRAVASTERVLVNALSSAWDAVFHVAKVSIRVSLQGVLFVLKITYNTVAFFGSLAIGAVGFVAQAPAKVFGQVASSSAVNSIIQPSGAMEVPVIDSQLAQLYGTQPKTSVAPAATNKVIEPPAATVAWPIRGRVTTQFGVPHMPYQVTHTGLDISSGQRSGLTPIHSFKAGRVISVISSSRGLGNHVVVDHGEGLTSVYAHMHSISATIGQIVDSNTVLGFEGSTGLSTGPHLHFEIRLNGQSVNPKQYINGLP